MGNLLHIRNLVKRYPGFTLDRIGLAVEEGCVTGLVGSNGAGKTTAIKAALGLVLPDEGSIELFGKDYGPLGARDAATKRRIGVVFDSCAFPPEITVDEVARIGRHGYPTWDQNRFDLLARDFDLAKAKFVKDLSRGMGMKLALAFALAHHPELLILDEPTAGLDPMAREDVLDILRDFISEEGRGVLLSSHITSDLEKIADVVTCIDQGRIVFSLPKDDICATAGIARCRTTTFESIAHASAPGIAPLHYIRHEYSVDALVPDRFAFARAFPETPCDPANIEGYMALALKGESL